MQSQRLSLICMGHSHMKPKECPLRLHECKRCTSAFHITEGAVQAYVGPSVITKCPWGEKGAVNLRWTSRVLIYINQGLTHLGAYLDFGGRASTRRQRSIALLRLAGRDPPAKFRCLHQPKSGRRSIALNRHAGGSNAMCFLHFPELALQQ